MQSQNELLEKINDELDRFVHSTSHDLKVPLNSILGLVNIAEISKSSSEVNYRLEMNKGRVKVLNHYIVNILNYSRNIHLDVEIQSIDLKELLMEVLDELEGFSRFDAIQFRICVPHGFKINLDKNGIRLVL